jgi:hypothetical protein
MSLYGNKEKTKMNDTKEAKKVFECTLKYVLQEGTDELAGDAEAILFEESLTVMPKFGEALFFSLRDIESIAEGDHRLVLVFTSGEKLTLYHLGFKYGDFARILSQLRNEMTIKDLLMNESVRKSGLEAVCDYFSQSGANVFAGKCEPRLYETALVVLPEYGEPIRVPYSCFDKVETDNYTLILTTEYGEKLVFSRMGRDFELFTDSLSEIMNGLSLKVQSSLKELLPQSDPAVIRKSARLMKEGKAAPRGKLEAISPDLWTKLEKKLETAGIKPEYDFLSSMARREKKCIGIKRGLLGDLTGEYIWFLIPVYSQDSGLPGNAVAMEAASGRGGGRATYFFRLTSRSDYNGFKDIEELDAAADDFIVRFNRCMLEINFRREPIYLPEERLDEPRYLKYKTAFRKIPALMILRLLFIGRVFHRSQEQWEQDVLDLLRFNVSTTEDDLPWGKGAAYPQAESEDDNSED